MAQCLALGLFAFVCSFLDISFFLIFGGACVYLTVKVAAHMKPPEPGTKPSWLYQLRLAPAIVGALSLAFS